MKISYKIALITLFAGAGAFAQKKDEDLGSEVVNIVRPYTPTISDAFKVKETPVIEDEQDTKKEEIKYNIFSFPVASTFSPAKGKAAAVDKEAREKLYNNYATLGVGNYGTINAELFVTQNLENNQYVGGMLRHLSSQGGIKDVVLDDNYSNTGLDLTYGSRQKELTWNADLGYQRQAYNWYGLTDPNSILLSPEFTYNPAQIANIADPTHVFSTIYVGGRVTTRDSFFHEVEAQFKHFSDDFDSSENRFFIKPSLDIPIGEQKVKFDFVADYVGGSFDRISTDYSSFNLGVQPSLLYQDGDLSAQFGAGIFYSMGKINEEKDNKVFIYPQIKVSYKIVGDLLGAYAGAEGALKQNSYADIVSLNPFVSPDLYIQPTDQKYDIYAGLKGKLASTVAFNLRAGYAQEGNHAFFLTNYIDNYAQPDFSVVAPYGFGNSFRLVYDDLKTLSFFGELKADFSKNVRFGINGTYYSYSTNQAEAWNLPEMKVGANLDVDITPKWFAGVNVFFVGERKDFVTSAFGPRDIVTLDSYFDVNANLGYKYSERLTGFLKLNNLVGQNYEKWLNYPVQGFQFMLGASYKFNF
ncbi:MAG: TonB-dependent receptor [Bacteroidota bacterium]